MRQVSEQFKEIQDEIIRPPLKLYFEIDSNVENSIIVQDIDNIPLPRFDFDQSVAPLFMPADCSNERYYAVVGDGKPVDDPNRICAPTRTSWGFTSLPESDAPMGVTPYTAADTETVIASSSNVLCNFKGFSLDATLSFKGGHIPDVIRVERYDEENSTWVTETTINNDNLEEEIYYVPESSIYSSWYHRFCVKNTENAGRFQFNWIRHEIGNPIAFKNENIAGVTINQETDFTSQTLPSFEMTIECLDVDEIYTPDSDVWKEKFQPGKACYFKLGYDIGEGVYYVPFFWGTLTKEPTYSEDKITFNVAIDFNNDKNFVTSKIPFRSIYTTSISTGDETAEYSLPQYILESKLFDKFSEAFDGFNDLLYLMSNYYGNVEPKEARQLVANACGAYIIARSAAVNLYSTNEIQYKEIADYLTRFEQVKNTLENQEKVRKVFVSRSKNTLSSEYVEVSHESETFIANDITYIDYIVPFWAIGSMVKVSPSITGIDIDSSLVGRGITEKMNDDGTVTVTVPFKSTRSSDYVSTSIVRFRKVSTENFNDRARFSGSQYGEDYINDNKLVTNEYVSGKIMRAALFINETPEKYDVDVVQDFRYELGDVIRLETRKNVFRTCVISGLQHVLPGSSGHLTCRKIFSLLDSNISFYWTGATIQIGTDTTLTILELSGDVAVAGWQSNAYDNDNRKREIILFNVKKFQVQTTGGSPVVYENSITVTDNNGHDWGFSYYVAENVSIQSDDIPLKHTKSYQRSSPNIDSLAFGAINLIEAIYSDQNMTAPVDYDCEYIIT